MRNSHILCEPSLAFWSLFKLENWTVKTRFFYFLLICSYKLSGFFKPVVRCSVLHNFECLLQKFRLNIWGFVQYLCQFFFLETVPRCPLLENIVIQTVHLPCMYKKRLSLLSSLRYWALLWWCLRNSFLCFLKMNNQKEGKNRKKCTF